MSKAQKRFESMRRNPTGDWTIADIEMVCREFGLRCWAPTRGSHFGISHDSQPGILTVPSRRAIKPIYIKAFVAYVEAVRDCAADG
jgi:hypothetical protein